MVERISGPGVSAPLPAQPVAAPERTGDPRTEAFQRSLATMLGSKVPVTVLSRLGDGSFMVRVADTAVRMALPSGTQPGATLPMKVLAASPQPTFQLGNTTLQASPLLPGAGAASAASLASALAGAGAADLSPGARLLAQVLQGATGQGTAVAGTTPLLPPGPPDPAQLAARLQGAISKSGLFYESHVAEWSEGKRALAELMTEPQAHKPAGTPPTDPALARLIDMQLASHEQGQVAWQGQLAAGQPFEWKVAREAGQDDGGRDAAQQETAWHSDLRLRFAGLGEVQARVSLRGGQVRIDLQVDDGALGPLRAGTARLEDALAAAGGELAALHIRTRSAP